MAVSIETILRHFTPEVVYTQDTRSLAVDSQMVALLDEASRAVDSRTGDSLAVEHSAIINEV
jgi:hypothetical protein